MLSASVVVSALGQPACYGGLPDNAPGGTDGTHTGTEANDAEADGSADGGTDTEGEVVGQCGEPITGPSTLRRLTNAQYRRTVRDLLGVNEIVSRNFAPDELSGSFKSNGTAPVGEIQVEQYMDAAESIASDAVVNLATLLPCDPATDGEDDCAEQFVRTVGQRAYRRPLEEFEVEGLMGAYVGGKTAGNFADGIRVALQSMLQSPFFLYHVELGASGGPLAEGQITPLTGFELASRLSYFLWDTMPDTTLFDAAEAGSLTTEAGLEAQIDRMLSDGRAAESIASFHLQWVGADEIESLEKNPAVYSSFTPQLAQAMKDETAAFANWVITDQDGRLETLLTSSVAVTEDPALLELYGVVPDPTHVIGEPHPLDPSQRAGLLTHASLLASHAHADQSSPVHRGVLLRENFLCTQLPPPPMDADNVPPDPKPGATTRERFAEHTSNPACAGCHVLIDGLGFGLEGYDGIGAHRAMEEGNPVDVSGEIVGTTDIDGPFQGGVELARRLASSEQVRDCVAEQWFHYALGRATTQDDACTREKMTEAFISSDQNIRELIKSIVLSDSFRFRATENN